MEWDVFISHASEDKEEVAIPLTRELEKAGLRVWLDQQELNLGDSLREKIEDGLAHSNFGVVVLSKHFLSKNWPKRELNGLFALEEDGRKRILPIWHKIDKIYLAQYAPILADKLAANTAMGIYEVASQITKVVLHPGSGSPSVVSPNIGRRLINLLEEAVSTQEIKDFLKRHPDIIKRAFGGTSRITIVWEPMLGSFKPDFCVGKPWLSINKYEWSVVIVDSPASQLFQSSANPLPSIVDHVAQLEILRDWLGQHLMVARQSLEGVEGDFAGIVVAGRREHLAGDQLEWLRQYNDFLFGVRVRTYDWLIDAALELKG